MDLNFRIISVFCIFYILYVFTFHDVFYLSHRSQSKSWYFVSCICFWGLPSNWVVWTMWSLLFEHAGEWQFHSCCLFQPLLEFNDPFDHDSVIRVETQPPSFLWTSYVSSLAFVWFVFGFPCLKQQRSYATWSFVSAFVRERAQWTNWTCWEV